MKTAITTLPEMLRLSGQTKAPVFDCSGEILDDSGAAELGPVVAALALPLKVQA